MKRCVIWLVILMELVRIGYASPLPTWRNSRLPVDTAKKICDIAVQGNAVLNSLAYVDVFDIYKGTLYLIIKDRLVELDMTSAKWSINQPVTDFLRHAGKSGGVVSKLLVRDNTYYMSILGDLFAVSTSGKYGVIDHSNGLIYDFNLTDGDKFLIATRDSIELLTKEGYERKFISFSSSNSSGFSWSSQGLCYFFRYEDSVQEFQGGPGGTIRLTEYAPLIVRSGTKDLFLSYSTDNYLLCFPYGKRNVVYAFRKDGVKDSPYRKISLGYDLTPTLQQIRDEEGTPNLKIICEDHQGYVLAVSKGRFKIFGFTL